MKAWLLDRSGAERILSLVREQGSKPVPTRLSWLYTTGALALFFFALQFFTGCLLLTVYVPEETLAFKSVQTIEYHARLGWLIRQMHSWGASFIIIVLVFHMFKVLWYGSYKRPREFTWFVGMLLLGLSMMFCFSGYLLPWNELSFWATRVSLGAVKSLPVIGEPLKQLICGGEEVSGATLGRFFALHVVVLPLALLGLIGYHLALITWKGISPKTTVTEEIELGNKAALAKGGSEPFFPRQVYRDLIACNIGFALLVTFATWWPWHLGQPADPINTPHDIKPEWYFLPMYQFLKYFDNNLYEALPFLKVIAPDPAFLGVLTINVVGLLVFFLPVLDRSKERKITRRPVFATIALVVLLGVVGMGFLGYISDSEFMGYKFDSKGFVVSEEKDAAEGKDEAGEESSEEDSPGGGDSEEGGGGSPAEEEEDEDDAGEEVAEEEQPVEVLAGEGGTCGSCHKHERQVEDWQESVHHTAGVRCVDCHGGIDTRPPEKLLLALELLFEADEEASREPEEEEVKDEEKKDEEKKAGEDSKPADDEEKKAEEKPAGEEKSESKEELPEEKEEAAEPPGEKAEGGKPGAGEEGVKEEPGKPAEEKAPEEKPASQEPAGEQPGQEKPAEEKPAEEKPAEEKPAEEEPAEEEPEEKEPPKPKLEIKWHKSIETPGDKRLFLYAHQGMRVDSRGRPDHPDDDDLEAAGKLCGRCHEEVLEHYLAARVPGAGSEAPDAGTAHTKACWDCHDNHEVQKPGVDQWEDEGYTDEDDELTGPFQQIKAELDDLEQELERVRGKAPDPEASAGEGEEAAAAEEGKGEDEGLVTLYSLEEEGYPVDGNVGEQDRFDALALKAKRLRPAVHLLDVAYVKKEKKNIVEGLEALSREMQDRQAGRKSAETTVVALAWIVAVLCSLLCFLKLFSIGKESQGGAGETKKKKPGKSTRSKKKEGGRKRKASGRRKKSGGRDISEFDSERDALLEPLDPGEEDSQD
ncbi:MAG: cytochrome b N-terminal domain-containing protein [Planctomycetota bacterium]